LAPCSAVSDWPALSAFQEGDVVQTFPLVARFASWHDRSEYLRLLKSDRSEKSKPRSCQKCSADFGDVLTDF
jgi:hypothetical protein